jgi:hypothetical protein
MKSRGIEGYCMLGSSSLSIDISLLVIIYGVILDKQNFRMNYVAALL